MCYMFSQDADEVNDLFQEVLVNLWKGFEGFEHRSDIKTWIYRVALNTCISLDRKKRRSATVRLTMDINLFEDRNEDTRQVDMLHKRISKLQPFDRAIVLLWLECYHHNANDRFGIILKGGWPFAWTPPLGKTIEYLM